MTEGEGRNPKSESRVPVSLLVGAIRVVGRANKFEEKRQGAAAVQDLRARVAGNRLDRLDRLVFVEHI
jgi:hypothetical protein